MHNIMLLQNSWTKLALQLPYPPYIDSSRSRPRGSPWAQSSFQPDASFGEFQTGAEADADQFRELNLRKMTCSFQNVFDPRREGQPSKEIWDLMMQHTAEPDGPFISRA